MAGEDGARARGQAAVEADARPARRGPRSRPAAPGGPRRPTRGPPERLRRERSPWPRRRGRPRPPSRAGPPGCDRRRRRRAARARPARRRPAPARRALAPASTPAASRSEREQGVAGEEALGQGRARVAGVLAAVEEPEPQGVPRQEAGQRGEGEAHAGRRRCQHEPQHHRLDEEAPASVLHGERHGPPRNRRRTLRRLGPRGGHRAASSRLREPRSSTATATTSGTTPATRKTVSAAERAHSSVWNVPPMR